MKIFVWMLSLALTLWFYVQMLCHRLSSFTELGTIIASEYAYLYAKSESNEKLNQMLKGSSCLSN